MRRDLALAHPFDERLKRHQDFAFILKLASAGINFAMVDEALVTVHWETLHETRRHINLEATRQFLREYASLMSPAARACFWVRCAVIPLLCDNRRRDALHAALSEPQLAFFILRWPRIAIMMLLGLIGINPLALADLKRKVMRLCRRNSSPPQSVENAETLTIAPDNPGDRSAYPAARPGPHA
jgi:hypothetical protein